MAAIAEEPGGGYGSGHDEENRVFPRPLSVDHERSALDHPASLFDFAQRLYQRSLDGPLPPEDRCVPVGPVRPRMRWRERKAALTAVLRDFLADPALTPADLLERSAGLDPRIELVQDLVRDPSPRLVDAARWLVESSPNRGAVLLGLGLLVGRAGPHGDCPDAVSTRAASTISRQFSVPSPAMAPPAWAAP